MKICGVWAVSTIADHGLNCGHDQFIENIKNYSPVFSLKEYSVSYAMANGIFFLCYG